MTLEIHALFNTNDCPHRLKSSGDDEFYYYFPPPLPEFIVLFMITKQTNEVNCAFKVTVCIDNDLDDKYIGEMGKDRLSICWNGSWTDEEISHAETAHSLGRVFKLSVFKEDNLEQKSSAEGSQSADDHINSSIRLLEAELDENQKAIKKLHRNMNEPGKTSAKDFFKKRKIKKSTEEEQFMNGLNGEIASKDKGEGSAFDFEDLPLKSPKITNGTKLGAKRNSPFASKPKLNKKSCIDKSSEMFTMIMNKSRSPPSASSSYAARFSDLLPTKNPSNRWNHCFCQTDDGNALVVGGEGANKGTNPDSLWSLDTATSTWHFRATNDISIPCRVGHTACYDAKNKALYLYGGVKLDTWYSDVHILDMNTWKWSKLETIGKAPTRAYHSCTMDGDELLIFGGLYPASTPGGHECSNELLIFNKDSKSWYAPIVSGDIPPKRSGHTSCLIGMKLYIFGGSNEPHYFDDLHVLDLGIMNFVKQNMIGSIPSPRTWHALHLFSDGKRFCIYGGFDGERALNDIYIFHALDNSWTKMFHPGLVRRAGHGIIRRVSSNDAREKLLVFGGGDNEGNFYSDLATIVLS